MADEIEIADMLEYIAEFPEDFEVEEIAEVLKEAASIIRKRYGSTLIERGADLDDLDPTGSA
jgi:hypothetical protein